jgi:hypothetical protein
MSKQKQKEAVYSWLNGFLMERQPDLLAVTLTFKQAIKPEESAGAAFIKLDRERAEKNVRHFLNKLNQNVLGKRFRRFKKRLISVPVYEKGEDKRFHAHLVLEKPPEITLEAFIDLVDECWQSTDFGYKDMDIQTIVDSGWISYMLKNRTKPEGVLEAIDLQNCHLTDHRTDSFARR